MFKIGNFVNNDDVGILDAMGPFQVIEYQKDLSVSPQNAMAAYFCHAMHVRRRLRFEPGQRNGPGGSHAVDGGKCKSYHWY